MIISEVNIEKARRQILSQKERPIIVMSQDDNFNRKILENGKFDVLLSPEKGKGAGGFRQADSGFNHVLAKIAAKNHAAIGIDLHELANLSKIEKAERLAKVSQNIEICRKSKTKLAVLNATSKREAYEFLLSLGSSTQQATETLYI